MIETIGRRSGRDGQASGQAFPIVDTTAGKRGLQIGEELRQNLLRCQGSPVGGIADGRAT